MIEDPRVRSGVDDQRLRCIELAQDSGQSPREVSGADAYRPVWLRCRRDDRLKWSELRRGGKFVANARDQDGVQRVTSERRPSSHRLVQDESERVHIGAIVEELTERLLG